LRFPPGSGGHGLGGFLFGMCFDRALHVATSSLSLRLECAVVKLLIQDREKFIASNRARANAIRRDSRTVVEGCVFAEAMAHTWVGIQSLALVPQ